MVAKLRAALAGIHSAVVDVSASRSVIALSGNDVEDVLARAATLDFSLQGFPVGACAQTNIARTQGIIQRKGAHEFAIFVRASFAPYLRAWLEDARRG
jgi:sarcosine oxidase subunit gamma